MRFAVLTAARTGEVIGAQWSEIDPAERIWIVPASRMKAGREHRVPLSDTAVDLLREVAMLQPNPKGDGFVLSGARPGRQLSGMALLILLRRMERGGLTAHGFHPRFATGAPRPPITRARLPRRRLPMCCGTRQRQRTSAAI